METHDLIRKIRKYLEIKQEYMADQLDMDPKTYRKIENGYVKDVPEETINQIANLLNVHPDVLLRPEYDIKHNSGALPFFNSSKREGNNIPISEHERNLYERLLKEKEEIIQRLQAEVNFVKKLTMAEY